MKVLVLGGTGWLGHHVARKFLAAGHEVLAGCRGGKQTYLSDCAGLPIAHFDKTNEEDMKRVLASGYEVVIDTVPGKVTMDLVSKYAAGLRHYIHCSSTGGYAPLPYIPCDENAPYGGFPFGGGWTEKAMLDSYAMELHAKTGFPATSMRPCYITGIGMVPISNLGGREKDFMANIIAGRTIDLPNDGQALLQPVWVEDLAMSFLRAAENRYTAIGEIYNVTCDRAVTLTRYVELCAEAVGTRAKIACLPIEEMLEKYKGACGPVNLRFLSCHMCHSNLKARTQIGWAPSCTAEEIIMDTARWAAALE